MIRFFNAFILFPLLEKKAKRQIFPKYRELQSFNRLPLSEQAEIQKRELHKILLFSKTHIPYYRDLFQAHSFDVDQVLKDVRHVEKLPLLTKDIVRDQTDRIKQSNGRHKRKTGGSTGQSVFFYYDDEGLDWTSAINLLAYDMAHNYRYRKDCHISSELGNLPTKGKPLLLDQLKLFSQNRQRLMITSFSDADLKRAYDQLVEIRPFLLQGHPSSGWAIADYIRRHELKGPTYCEVFEPSGETLTPKIVQTMEEYLGCKVVNRYGNAEFGVMAHSRWEDPYTRLQVFNRAFYFEEVNQGNLVVTNFTNYSMPLIRYDTGDIGTVKNEAEGTFLYDIQGRVHDTVRIADADYATHYIMDYLDHRIKKIRAFQILIRDDVLPVLNIVPEDAADQERIRQAVKTRWPIGLDIEFVPYEELKRVGWQQKFRHIIDLREKK